MKVQLRLFAFALFPASFAVARSIPAVTFNVIGFPEDGHKLAVKLGGLVTQLAVGDDQTVWSGAVQAAAGDEYSYVVVDASNNEIAGEPFTRTLSAAWMQGTPNEMFQKSATLGSIPALPQAYPAWPYGYTDTFNSSYIPTIHVISSSFEYDDVYTAASDGISVTMIMVTQHNVYKREKVTLSLGGNSNSEYRKRQLKLKMNGKEEIDGRQVFKLRAGSRDPSFLREKTYMDIVNSLGIPTQQGTHGRLFVNKRFFGVYLIEDLMGNTWAQMVLTGGKQPANAMLTDSGYGFDFVYRGDNLDAYDEQGYHLVTWGPETLNPIEKLIPVIKKVNEFDPKTATDDQVEELKQLIDFNLVHRHACLEYLALNWDGSWHSASNLFFTFTNGKWFFAPTDFDMTLGYVISAVRGGFDAPYTNWTKPKDPKSEDGKSYTGRPLFDNTLPHPTFKRMFEDTCRTIVQTVFHKAALQPRLKALHDFLRGDIANDRNPAVFNPPAGGGTGDYHWTIEHFDYGYDDGDWTKYGLSVDFDCDGILNYVHRRADFVASQLGFTYEDTYTAPVASSLYGGDPGSVPTNVSTAAAAAQSAVSTPVNTTSGESPIVMSTWVLMLALALGATALVHL